MNSQRLLIFVLAGILLAGMLAGCGPNARMAYQQGLVHFQARQFDDALVKFDEAQAKEPESKVIQFYRARTLYELERYEAALEGLEKFLVMTDEDRATYGDDRDTADFYILKCKQELGIPVEQAPEDIPEERMRY